MVFEAAGIFGVIEWMRPGDVQADGFSQDVTFTPDELVEVVVYEEANQLQGRRELVGQSGGSCPRAICCRIHRCG